MEPILERVKEFADKAHWNQTRKYSTDRYIVHPMRVMMICRGYTSNVSLLCAAILHDVLEDTSITEEALSKFLFRTLPAPDAARTLELVEELTDVYVKKKFPAWNRRKRKQKEVDRLSHASADAQTIKYADIMDNCPEIATKDPDFADRYLRECRHLLGKMRKGNHQLLEQALGIVHSCMILLKNNKKIHPGGRIASF